jgi:hypothetical protein
VDAGPAVLGLPDQVREEQHHRDRHRQREPWRAEQVTTPHTKRRQQQDHDDRERVLDLQPHADGQPEQRPRPRPSASRNESHSTTMVASWSKETGWKARWSRPGSARTPPPPPPGSGRGVRRRGRVPPARRQRSWPHRPGSQRRGTRPTTSQTAPAPAPTTTPSPAGTRHSRPAGGGRRPRSTARRAASRTGQRPRDGARTWRPPRPAPAGSPTGTTGHRHHPHPTRLPPAPAAAGTAFAPAVRISPASNRPGRASRRPESPPSYAPARSPMERSAGRPSRYRPAAPPRSTKGRWDSGCPKGTGTNLGGIHGHLLRGRPSGVSAQAPELGERKIGITPFDCPR